MIINTVMQGATVSGSVTPTGNPLPSKTWIPTTEDQIIKANSYTTGEQTIKGDPALISQNIASGISIFGVSGTYTNIIPQSSTPTELDIRKGKIAYANGSIISGNLETNNAITINGSWIHGEAGIYPSINQYMPNASINFNSSIVIPSTAITPSVNASSGKVIITINGTQNVNYNVSQSGYISPGNKNGTMSYNGGLEYSLPIQKSTASWTPTASTVDQIIPAGTYLTGDQIIKNDPNLLEENIKKDVQIYNLRGTYVGSNCETKSGGGTWAQCCAFTSGTNAKGWREEKYTDGRLIRWVWEWWTVTNNGMSKTTSFDNINATPFVGTPIVTCGSFTSGNTAATVTLKSWSENSITYYIYESYYTGNIAVCFKFEGFWS